MDKFKFYGLASWRPRLPLEGKLSLQVTDEVQNSLGYTASDPAYTGSPSRSRRRLWCGAIKIVGEAFRLPRDGKPVPYSIDRMAVRQIQVYQTHIVILAQIHMKDKMDMLEQGSENNEKKSTDGSVLFFKNFN